MPQPKPARLSPAERRRTTAAMLRTSLTAYHETATRLMEADDSELEERTIEFLTAARTVLRDRAQAEVVFRYHDAETDVETEPEGSD